MENCTLNPSFGSLLSHFFLVWQKCKKSNIWKKGAKKSIFFRPWWAKASVNWHYCSFDRIKPHFPFADCEKHLLAIFLSHQENGRKIFWTMFLNFFFSILSWIPNQCAFILEVFGVRKCKNHSKQPLLLMFICSDALTPEKGSFSPKPMLMDMGNRFQIVISSPIKWLRIYF